MGLYFYDNQVIDIEQNYGNSRYFFVHGDINDSSLVNKILRDHDIDSSKIQSELGWDHKISFEDGLKDTVRWYLENTIWIESIRSGKYRDWPEKNYKEWLLWIKID